VRNVKGSIRDGNAGIFSSSGPSGKPSIKQTRVCLNDATMLSGSGESSRSKLSRSTATTIISGRGRSRGISPRNGCKSKDTGGRGPHTFGCKLTCIHPKYDVIYMSLASTSTASSLVTRFQTTPHQLAVLAAMRFRASFSTHLQHHSQVPS
jgi:hypothetical protein